MATNVERGRWWKSRGHRDLTLLLWAVWNPIGTCPLDEYDSHSLTIAGLLRKAHDLGGELARQADADETQSVRDDLRTETVELLATALAKIRTNAIGLPPDPLADQRAASVLFDWYEWSMEERAAPD
jgi:hypothetical protein